MDISKEELEQVIQNAIIKAYNIVTEHIQKNIKEAQEEAEKNIHNNVIKKPDIFI